MGASSSGLLDEAKISNIKGLVDSTFQSFSEFYRLQYSASYIGHVHQEVEPKKEGRSLLLTKRPQYNPEEVLYQGSVKFSCWHEQGKKCKERYVVLRRDYKVEIHENLETLSRGCPAKLVLQPVGASVFSSEKESRAHLEHTCAGILNGVKEDSSSASSSSVLAVYLHLPYMGHSCFLFQQEKERDDFLSALKTCIRHGNLEPWCDWSYESEAYVHALRLYRQHKGSYESWEKLLGTQEQVLAAQVMEEVLPWLQSQLQSRLKGKKSERIQQWLATVQASYSVVLQQLTESLSALREECRQTVSANQALIRSNLDQIMSSQHFLEEKVKGCICEEAERECSVSVAPFMSSILEALTETIGGGTQSMRHTLHTHMDKAFTHSGGGTEEVQKALSPLSSISLDQSYRQVENLTEKLEGLKQRFGWSSTQRLVQSAHLEMEKLLDSAVYTLELFLKSSARLQPSLVPVKMERAKERVLKQLDYDSRLVQRRLYLEALLEITLPALTKKMDTKWENELQQFEQYIFSDYSSFILVRNVYDDVLRNIVSKEIETVVQNAANQKSSRLLIDTSDLAISQYSLLGHTPPRSAPDSPTTTTAPPHASSSSSSSSSSAPGEAKEAAPPVEEEGGHTVTIEVPPQSDNQSDLIAKSEPSTTQSTVPLSPVIVITQQVDEAGRQQPPSCQETQQEVQPGNDIRSTTESEPSDPATPHSEAADLPAESTNPPPDSSDLSTDVTAECAPSDQSAPPSDLSTSEEVTEDPIPVLEPRPSPPCTDSPVQISLGTLSEAVGCSSAAPPVVQTTMQQPTDRAVYLTGEIKHTWEVERVKEQQKEEEERIKDAPEEIVAGQEKEEEEEIEEEGGKSKGVAQSGGEPGDEGCSSSGSPAGGATEPSETEEEVQDEEKGGEVETEILSDEEEAEEEDCGVKEDKAKEEEGLRSPRPIESQEESDAELPLDGVALIRSLVTEVTEVETVVRPCPSSTEDNNSIE
ncbi:protein Niban 1-like [Centropristis striata]|uniref:protein Niban 1-like n=1 Tax=Centropristis striata TaxID=184440 RepID=UPI0027E17BD7|nr:protein Niban 1-like [Centropristis striata]